jgi:bacterioferritin-associated ferredoxin
MISHRLGISAMIICICRRVSERDIERAVHAGADSFEAIQIETGAATCCGRCGDCARGVIDRAGRNSWSTHNAVMPVAVAA